MTAGLKPIRRVVTGDDEQGRSKVVWDGPAPAMHAASMRSGRGHIDFWVWNESPVPLSVSPSARHPYMQKTRTLDCCSCRRASWSWATRGATARTSLRS